MMSESSRKLKTLKEIANELSPSEEKIKFSNKKTLKEVSDELGRINEIVKKPSKTDLMNKLTLAIVLAKIAPTKKYSYRAIKLSESVIKLGLTNEEIEKCKKRAVARIEAGRNKMF